MRASFIEEAICQKDAKLLSTGTLAVTTGRHEERVSASRFFVQDEEMEIDFGDYARVFDKERAADFFRTLQTYMAQSRVFEVHAFLGSYPVEFLTTSAWHAAAADLFFRESFIEDLANRATLEDLPGGTIRIWHDPYLKPSQFEISSPDDAFVLIDPSRFTVAILGTAYAGEIKCSAFMLLECLLAGSTVLPLQASANCREDGSGTCLFLGASGSGKTTLARQSGRFLIADDQLAWSGTGVSNFEAACYARAIQLSDEFQKAALTFGSIVENVAFDDRTRLPDFSRASRSENSRATFKIDNLSHIFDQSREAEVPETIVLLVADEFGALPAVARLDRWQACRHLGSRVSSAQKARLAQKIEETGADVWLLNTGWRQGRVEALDRYPLPLTRRWLELIQSGDLALGLEKGHFEKHPVFGFDVPASVEIPSGPQVETFARQLFGLPEDSSSTGFSGFFSETGSALSSSESRRRFTSGGI
jgi:phosphoenolpyruvate carboxykinase (ATP)